MESCSVLLVFCLILISRVDGRPRELSGDKYRDIFDCVDIYSQPALDHPLLQNHTIQMVPSSYPTGASVKFISESAVTQSLVSEIACPEGSVPVWRPSENYMKLKSSLKPLQSQSENITQYMRAQYSVEARGLYGTQAKLSVYEPLVKANQSSEGAVYVMNGHDGTFNAIWAGWYVYPQLSGDFRARLHVAWTDSNNPDCFDLFCAGFVQVSSRIAPGVRLVPVSTYKGPQYQMTILLYKDHKTKNWWLLFGNNMQPVGYWPDSLFSSLSGEASRLVWGGSIKTNPWLPSPPMGSGHFPSEGFGKAAYVYDIKIVDEHNTLRIPSSRFFTPHVNEHVCYDVAGLVDGVDGVGFYYGGPGGCNL